MVLCICVLTPLVTPPAGASYTPPFTTLRIGLFFGSNALPSANLQNVNGFGSGFEFGYFDSNRNFVSIGARTDENRISMLMDRNMVWDSSGPGAGEYREGDSGPVIVGCFHIQPHQGYNTFEEARADADLRQNAFVRYQPSQSRPFLVLMENYTTRAEAEGAIASMGLAGAIVNSGTANTVVVTVTGTNNILFEFDMGATPFGVMPLQAGETQPETWFRGYRYHGGFQYARRDGALLTVVNYVYTEDYIKGILPYEMSNAWPLDALKAQAVCARTYAMAYLNRHGSFDLCVEEHCQVYRGRGLANSRTDQAVDETAGVYMTHNGVLCRTFYASSNGGASENIENVWTEALPYLRGVVDPWEADVAHRIAGYNWTITLTQADVTARLRNRGGFNNATIVSMEAQFTALGNVRRVVFRDSNGANFTVTGRDRLNHVLGVPSIRFHINDSRWEGGGSIYINDSNNILGSGTSYAIDGEGRTAALPSGPLFAVTGTDEIQTITGNEGGGGGPTGPQNGVFTLRGTGRGHNVGMSQWGYSKAQHHNKTFEEIIHFYFTGIEITRTNIHG
jgi:stage II sporulation protein D